MKTENLENLLDKMSASELKNVLSIIPTKIAQHEIAERKLVKSAIATVAKSQGLAITDLFHEEVFCSNQDISNNLDNQINDQSVQKNHAKKLDILEETALSADQNKNDSMENSLKPTRERKPQLNIQADATDIEHPLTHKSDLMLDSPLRQRGVMRLAGR